MIGIQGGDRYADEFANTQTKRKYDKKAAIKEKKTKTAFVNEAIDEKLGVVRNRESALRNFAGWLTNKEAEELRHATKIFETIEEGDWK